MREILIYNRDQRIHREIEKRKMKRKKKKDAKIVFVLC